MRVSVKVCVIVSILLLSAGGYAQQNPDAQPKPASKDASLGDIARQLRKDKAKGPKPAIVVTNDNIQEITQGSAVSVTGAEKKSSKPPAVSPEEPGQVHDAAYYRARMKDLQARLDNDKRELAVMQQKLGQNQIQYYPNPQDALMQQYSRGDIDKLTADIDAQKQQIADDEKAVDDLHDQLRREGGDPGWLR